MAESWTEKHRPLRLHDVLGNSQAIGALRKWAESWRTGTPEKRAVLLHGPPGTGKTSAALALAQEFGWGVVELNASDVRSGPAIRRIAGSGARHETFSSTGEYFASAEGKRKLIVLDEADNLYERGGEAAMVGDTSFSDRGGRRAIMETIAEARQPIVLIANDSYALTRGAGAGFRQRVLVVPFHGLTAPTIQKMLARVAADEGIKADEALLREIANASHGDARSALNDLQALGQGRKEVRAAAIEILGERNRSETMVQALATIFRGGDGRASRDAIYAVDETPDFLLAWLDENTPREYRDPQDLQEAFEWLSRADVFLGRVQRRQSYSLWGTSTDLMALGVTGAKGRTYGTPPAFQFPSWIRRMSSSKSERELRRVVAAKIAQDLHVGHRVARQDMIPFLQALLPRSAELAETICLRFDLDEDEMRMVLGAQAAEDFVEQVIEHVLARREQPKAQTDVVAEAGPAEAPAKSPSRSLLDF